MAQLISFVNANTGQQQPNVPGFQYWATRKASYGALPYGPNVPGLPAFPWTTALLFIVTCIANTAHAIVGKLVTIQLAGVTVVFQFTETTAAPGNIAVVVSNGDTAAQCAIALRNAVQAYVASTAPDLLVAQTSGYPVTATGQVVLGVPEGGIRPFIVTTGGTAPALAVTNNNGGHFGDALLRTAWRAMVYLNQDPLGWSGVPAEGAEIALPFYPLHPVARKAWPGQIIAIALTPAEPG